MKKKIVLLLCAVFALAACEKPNDLGIESGKYEVVSVYQYPSTGRY